VKLDPGPLVTAAGGTLRSVARRLEVDPALLCRPLSVDQADRYATRLGLHPAEVWAGSWWAACRPPRRTTPRVRHSP
jgi:hypothetical protein